MINILLIAVFCVIVIDLSGFIDNIEDLISKWMGVKCKIPKPFSCSLCSSWWLSLIYVFIAYGFNFYLIVFSIVIAYMTPVIKDLLILLKDIAIKMINLLYKWLKL